MSIQFFLKYFQKCIGIICFFCFSNVGRTQLVADYNATPLKGCAPLLVQFTDLSTGSPTSWYWDLGNGNTSVSQNPGTIYFTPGSYAVKLVVKSAAGIDSVIRTNYVVVSDKPAVAFNASDTVGCTPLFVQFTDQSVPGSGNITQWHWDFGDGNTSVLQSPSNLYTTPGTYNITLNVVNSGGCNTTVTRIAYIKILESPNASFSTTSTTSCSPPVTVSFTNASAGNNLTTYNWSFGDGGTATTANPSHNFTTAGVFNTVLIVGNQSGCKDTISKIISIGAVTPNFSAPDTACVNTSLAISNTSLPSTVSAFWDFGDGTNTAQINPSKTYSSPGTYTIKLVNNFGACTDSISKPIVIINGPTANFTFTGPIAACAVPVTVSFTSISTGAVSYSWDFGDGGTSSIQNPTHTFTTQGVFSVRLTVTSASGCKAVINKSNLISITNPNIVSISGLPINGCAPYSNNFVPSIVTPEPITAYAWTFGDGGTSTQAAPTHTYSTTGTYDVTLIVTTTSGCRDTLKLPQSVAVGVRPVANFTATPTNGCAYQSVQFTNTSTGPTDSWLWTFGDTITSPLQNPLHHYIDTGFFTVTFVVSNNGCRDTITRVNYIYVKPPIAFFTIRNYCDTPYLKRFVDKSIGGVIYLWDFGDGNTSTAHNPKHLYATKGAYTVKLRVTNPPCFDEFIDTIYVIDEQPVITVSNAIVCKNNPVTIRASGITTTNIIQYRWDFGDGSIDSTSVPLITHQYISSGSYNITLRVINKLGCKKFVTLSNALTVYGPTARLSHPAGGCLNSTITFTDQSIPYNSFNIVSWTIDYGDGTILTTASPVFTHVYNALGTYNIVLIVKDSYGCSDTLRDTKTVTISTAKADIVILDSISCRQSLVHFSSNSQGSGLSYLWNFGDGGTSASPTTSHIYTTDGLYTISLRVTDQYGCVDSAKKDTSIRISNVVAKFTLSDSIINCPPAQIGFTNQSTSYSSLTWFFDDGGTSVNPNPIHFFLNGGVYNIKLVAKGYGSCSDSMIKQIRVRGPQGNISYTPIGHCVPATVNFTGNATNITGTFTWDFGDGNTQSATGNTTTHTYATVGRYIPKLLLRDATINCTVAVFGNDTISVSDAKAFIKTPPYLYCDSITISLLDSSIIQYDSVIAYKWTFSDGGSSSAQNPIHIFSAPGFYTINMNLSTKNGCKDTAAPVNIKVVKRPDASLLGNGTVCLNDPITFSASLALPDTSATSYQWTFGNGNTSTQQLPPQQVYAIANTYSVLLVATNSSGCTDTTRKQLTVFPLPLVNAGADTIICRGQSITLTPIGATSYIWQSSPWLSCYTCTSPLAKADSTIKYIVTGTSADGCLNNDTIKVTVVQPSNLSIDSQDTLCKGQKVPLTVSGADNYSWSPALGLSSTTISSPLANPDTTTTYQVIGTDLNSCFADTAYVSVAVYPIPGFNIVADELSLSSGNYVTITTTGSPDITSYSWTPATGLSCTNCSQPQANPVTTTTYTAVVTNAGGCKWQDQVTVRLLCSNGNLFVPNTFSPNGDGSNDVFFPRGKGINSIRNLAIYNRWGIVVFQRTSLDINDENAGWDGTYKGQQASQDVYVYHFEVVCSSGEKFIFKGDVTLIR